MTDFRNKGVKCSTNITPVISINDRDQGYSTLQELVAKGYVVTTIVSGISLTKSGTAITFMTNAT